LDLFGVPLATAVFAGAGLYQHWSTEHHRFTKVSAILLATAATLLGLLLSFLGTILGLVTLRFPRWFSSLALGVSAWMLVLFFLAGSTY
jgi:hypothetical protein